MGVLIFLAIPILARVSRGVVVLVDFIAGIIVGSIIFHYISIKRSKNTMAWISGIAVSAAIGAVLNSIMGVNTPIGITLGAIGGALGAVIGILH